VRNWEIIAAALLAVAVGFATGGIVRFWLLWRRLLQPAAG